jgi:dTDP-4-dehydrorhamnose 3,5-epimerase
MIFTETSLAGAFVIDLDKRLDNRGFFARTFSRDEFRARGLEPTVVQANVSFNHKKGTVRGMHFQFPPAAETKLVRCTRGSVVDVIVDLRPESPTFLQHTAVELSNDNGRSIYVPKRFAHGYQVLEDGTEVTYLTSEDYAPQHEGGLPYDDPGLAIVWPLAATEMSPKDRAWKSWTEVEDTIRTRMTLAPVAASASESGGRG